MSTTKPNTLVEAIRFFANPDTAFEFMKRYVFPNGVVCPKCGGKEHYFLKTRKLWKCKAKECAKQFSIKTGTIMEDSALSLDKWLVAVWMLANAKNGISSYEVHRALGITQKTAWFMLQRVRLAMKQGTFTKMSGTVEADEAFIGGKLRNFKKSRMAALKTKHKKPGKPVHVPNRINKAIIMGLLERGQNGQPSQVRTSMIQSTRRPHVQDTIRKNVEPNSLVMTDALASYNGLDAEFIHQTINHALSYAQGSVHTNGIENFWSLLKRTLEGTYVACEPFHLFRYLDEQTFRFNNRKTTDGVRFIRVLESITGKRLTYRELIGETEGAGSSTTDGGAASVIASSC